MSDDLTDLMERTAPPPSRALDVDEVRHRGRQLRRRRRTTTGIAMAATLAVAWVALGELPESVQPRIDERPDVATAPGSSEASSSLPSASPAPGVSPTEGPQGEILERPAAGQPAPAGDGRPAAPACAIRPHDAATITFRPEVPDPRCVAVAPGQQVAVQHLAFEAGQQASAPTITMSLGGYTVQLDAEEAVTLDLPVSHYLAPGVHRITSDFGPAEAEVWVLDAPAQSAGEQAVLDGLVRASRSRAPDDMDALPLADTVWLGRHDELVREVAAADLRNPAAWQLEPAGDAEPVSALDLLEPTAPGSLHALAGDHPACGQPPIPVPAALEDRRQLSLQPRLPEAGGCTGWFTVDVFLDDQQRITAVVVAD